MRDSLKNIIGLIPICLKIRRKSNLKFNINAKLNSIWTVK